MKRNYSRPFAPPLRQFLRSFPCNTKPVLGEGLGWWSTQNARKQFRNGCCNGEKYTGEEILPSGYKWRGNPSLLTWACTGAFRISITTLLQICFIIKETKLSFFYFHSWLPSRGHLQRCFSSSTFWHLPDSLLVNSILHSHCFLALFFKKFFSWWIF